MDVWVYGYFYELFEDILVYFDMYVKVGCICYIGVFNEILFGVMCFFVESDVWGLLCIVLIQNVYNFVNCQFEDGGLEEVCVCEQVSLFVYLLLVQGYFIGKYCNGVLLKGL